MIKVKQLAKPESSGENRDRKIPEDEKHRKTQFFNTSNSNEKDKSKQIHGIKQEALKVILSSL
jgi:hypothetical protein